MKSNLLLKIAAILFLGFAIAFFSHKKNNTSDVKLHPHFANPSGAGKSLDQWYFERAYPNDKLSAAKFVEAFDDHQNNVLTRTGGLDGEWESLGPKNIGGRTLCLAFHPTDENIIYAGSASGGLWRTTTQGIGEDAWEHIPTGFPVLGVPTVAINPTNPDEIIIGTGETYGETVAEPGSINRLTRGSYGIGILKTEDGGNTWAQVLAFETKNIKGVRDLEFSAQNHDEVYATTTDGLYQSLDGGDSWTLIFQESNCNDVLVDPNDGNIIYVTSGNFNYDLDPSLCGIFKSTDKGNSFTELLHPNLIDAWSGTANLDFDPTNSSILFAEIQVALGGSNGFTPAGLYKSNDAGNTWEKINDQDIAIYQGWYSHDLAINPNNTDEMMYVGVEAWKSTNGGNSFLEKSVWWGWEFGPVAVDVPEGDDDYVHADIHAVYYHPLVDDMVLMATDGGMFVSLDAGETYETRTGGMQTTQFYANIGNSNTNPDFLIGGTQDNATWVYNGTPTWSRRIGGDGMCAGVHPTNDQIVFGSYQYLNIRKSTDGGISFVNAKPDFMPDDFAAFVGPFEISDSEPNTMYAGATYLYKSTDAANNWTNTSSSPIDDGNVIITLAISPLDADLVYVSTTPDPLSPTGIDGAKLLKSTDGGATFSSLNGLPNRVCKDIVFDPINDDILYAVFSGFETDHVFKTLDGGDNWFSIQNGLPDIPTNTILVDPLVTEDVYVGNDLGVYYSENGGDSWIPFCEALPDATMIMHLDVSPADRKLRIATHGRGIYQRDLVTDPNVSVEGIEALIAELKIYPNPIAEILNIEIEILENADDTTIELFDFSGKKVADIFSGKMNIGKNNFTWNVAEKLSSGSYLLRFTSDKKSISKTIIVE